MTADDAWGIDDSDRKWCHDEISKLRAEGIFTPPSLHGTVVDARQYRRLELGRVRV